MVEKTFYTLIDNKTGERAGAYSRAYHTEYEFGSVREARSSNVNDIFKNKMKYRVQKWKVTYELIDDDVDPYKQETIPWMKDLIEERERVREYNEFMWKVLKDGFNEFTKCTLKELSKTEE